jgi:hypothetical protein
MTSKSTCSKEAKNFDSIAQKVKNIPFNQYAHRSGFKKRKEQKITGKGMIIGFFLLAMQSKHTLQGWAEQLYLLNGKTVSRQAVWERINDCFIRFLLMVLKYQINHQSALDHKNVNVHPALNSYKRILLQDSTTIALPDVLSKWYPGNMSRGKQKAILKIQVIYDLVSHRFVHFEITPFTANDQSKSDEIIRLSRSGDLVIRDLGYFSLNCFEKMLTTKISFVSRVKYGVKIYDAHSQQEINLLPWLRKHHQFDQWVLLGKQHRVPMRLVIEPLPQQQVDCRRMRAKQDRDHRLNHDKHYYELLGYRLFITSENQTVFTPSQIAKVYGLRWRIESIFKCWKSQFHLQRLMDPHVSYTKQRVQAIIYLMLLFILLFQVTLFQYFQSSLSRIKAGAISLIKLCRYMSSNIQRLLENPFQKLLQEIIYYCRYDQRGDLKNFTQQMLLA